MPQIKLAIQLSWVASKEHLETDLKAEFYVRWEARHKEKIMAACGALSNRQDSFWRTLWKMVFRSIISAIALCET